MTDDAERTEGQVGENEKEERVMERFFRALFGEALVGVGGGLGGERRGAVDSTDYD